MNLAAVLGKSTETAKGGELVARMLAAEGVTRVFGIMDGSYLGLCAALRPNGIDLITPRHETSAAHMAGAYAALTGKLGVCIASNGPGVANILPGVAVENAEGHRVLLITSCRREGIVYPDRGGTYQSFPQVEVTRPMTKWSGVVPSMARLAEFVRRALRESFEGRPGVVHLDIPESVMNGVLELGPDSLRPPSSYRSTTPMEAPADQVREVARWLDEAKLPLLHAGSGVLWAGATKELAELAAVLEAPVTTSWAARGAIDERDPHAISMIFVGAVNKARNAADRVLVLGSRLGETDWWGKAPYWADPLRAGARAGGHRRGHARQHPRRALRRAVRREDLPEGAAGRARAAARRARSPAPAASTSPSSAPRAPLAGPSSTRAARTTRCPCTLHTSPASARRRSPRTPSWSPTAATPRSGRSSSTRCAR